MRDESDLIKVEVTLTQELSVDLEQLEFSPVFRSIRDSLVSKDLEVGIDTILHEYVSYYINANSFPYNMPGTTGPGISKNIQVKVRENDESI
jgi:hypothetical protein